MQMNLADLQRKCESLGLTVVQKGKRPAKEDCVSVLRAHFMPKEGLPFTELTPMLCFAEWNLKPEEQKAVWSSPSWVAQKKLNGFRIIIHFVKGVGVFATSRNVSLKTFRLTEVTQSLLIKDFIPDFTATVDGEAIIDKSVDTRPYTTKGEITKTSLHSVVSCIHLEPSNGRRLQIEQNAPIVFHLFDVTKLGGVDCRSLRLIQRIRILDSLKDLIKATEIGKYFEFPEYTNLDKKEFFKQEVAAGGEGVVLKNLNSTYEDSSSRGRAAWVKAKKRIEYDCFVSGFKPGDPGSGWENLVGALEFSINTEVGVWNLGFCSNITMEERIAMTGYVNGAPVLKDEYYDRVAEISGQDISARSLRLSHCTLDRWRVGVDAKSKDECYTLMSDLKSRAEWVS